MGRTLNKYYTNVKALLERNSVPLVRLSAIFLCLTFWYGVYKLIKAIF